MSAMVIWILHDFPAFGIVGGCITKRYVGCPCCGPQTISRRSKALKKCTYKGCSKKYLLPNHYMRKDVVNFSEGVERHGPPNRVTTDQVVEWGASEISSLTKVLHQSMLILLKSTASNGCPICFLCHIGRYVHPHMLLYNFQFCIELEVLKGAFLWDR